MKDTDRLLEDPAGPVRCAGFDVRPKCLHPSLSGSRPSSSYSLPSSVLALPLSLSSSLCLSLWRRDRRLLGLRFPPLKGDEDFQRAGLGRTSRGCATRKWFICVGSRKSLPVTGTQGSNQERPRASRSNRRDVRRWTADLLFRSPHFRYRRCLTTFFFVSWPPCPIRSDWYSGCVRARVRIHTCTRSRKDE